ncbi:YecR family lipoprotein [Kingella potus]
MSFQKYINDPRMPDNDAAQEAAKKRCQAWGYSYAEPFDNITETCVQQRQGKKRIYCAKWRFTREYQCQTDSHTISPIRRNGNDGVQHNTTIQLQLK